MGANEQIPSLRKLVPGNPAVHGVCFTIFPTWLSCLCCMGVRELWLPWAEVQGVTLVGHPCDWHDLSCQQVQNTSQIQPSCHVSWHFTLKVNLVYAVKYQSLQSKTTSSHSEVAVKFSFVLHLHFYSPLTLCFPFSPVLFQVLPVFSLL